MTEEPRTGRKRVLFVATVLLVAAATAGATALLLNIAERKEEGRNPYVLLKPVTEDDTDPAVWGVNWPRQYEAYRRTSEATRRNAALCFPHTSPIIS